MTKKKIYEKPSMQVFELEQKPTLLQASGQAGVQDYDWNNVDPE